MDDEDGSSNMGVDDPELSVPELSVETDLGLTLESSIFLMTTEQDFICFRSSCSSKAFSALARSSAVIVI